MNDDDHESRNNTSQVASARGLSSRPWRLLMGAPVRRARILVVGAGAVGQVLGAALAERHEVAFLLKPSSAAAAKAKDGFSMAVRRLPIRLLLQFQRPHLRHKGLAVFVKPEEAAASGSWDVVILAIAAPALRDEQWLCSLVDSVVQMYGVDNMDGHTTTLCFVAGGVAGSERELLLRAGAHPAQLAHIGFTCIAWEPPLVPLSAGGGAIPGSGAVADSNTTVEFVSASPLLLSGPKGHVQPLAAALRAGGLPTSVVTNVDKELGYADAVLLPFCCGLEAAHWSFARLRRDAHLRALTAGASRECLAVTQATVGRSLLWMLVALFLRAWTIYLILLLAPLVLPFDLEAYLRQHFGLKRGVHGQTSLFLDAFGSKMDRTRGEMLRALRQRTGLADKKHL